ncbi:MAG: hypothetical protein ACRDQ0_01250, partial [Pseudonocardia sp.]
MVAIPGATATYPEHLLDDPQQLSEELWAYQATHHAFFENQPDVYLGGWLHEGKLWVEPSRNVQDRAEAIHLAATSGEIAIYDVDARSEIVLQDLDEPTGEHDQPSPGSEDTDRPRFLGRGDTPLLAVLAVDGAIGLLLSGADPSAAAAAALSTLPALFDGAPGGETLPTLAMMAIGGIGGSPLNPKDKKDQEFAEERAIIESMINRNADKWRDEFKDSTAWKRLLLDTAIGAALEELAIPELTRIARDPDNDFTYVLRNVSLYPTSQLNEVIPVRIIEIDALLFDSFGLKEAVSIKSDWRRHDKAHEFDSVDELMRKMPASSSRLIRLHLTQQRTFAQRLARAGFSLNDITALVVVWNEGELLDTKRHMTPPGAFRKRHIRHEEADRVDISLLAPAGSKADRHVRMTRWDIRRIVTEIVTKRFGAITNSTATPHTERTNKPAAAGTTFDGQDSGQPTRTPAPARRIPSPLDLFPKPEPTTPAPDGGAETPRDDGPTGGHALGLGVPLLPATTQFTPHTHWIIPAVLAATLVYSLIGPRGPTTGAVLTHAELNQLAGHVQDQLRRALGKAFKALRSTRGRRLLDGLTTLAQFGALVLGGLILGELAPSLLSETLRNLVEAVAVDPNPMLAAATLPWLPARRLHGLGPAVSLGLYGPEQLDSEARKILHISRGRRQAVAKQHPESEDAVRAVSAAAAIRAAGQYTPRSWLVIATEPVKDKLTGLEMIGAGDILEVAEYVDGLAVDTLTFPQRRQLATNYFAVLALLGVTDALDESNLVVTPRGAVVPVDFELLLRTEDLTFATGESYLAGAFDYYPDIFGLLTEAEVLRQFGDLVDRREEILAVLPDQRRRELIGQRLDTMAEMAAAGALTESVASALAIARRTIPRHDRRRTEHVEPIVQVRRPPGDTSPVRYGVPGNARTDATATQAELVELVTRGRAVWLHGPSGGTDTTGRARVWRISVAEEPRSSPRPRNQRGWSGQRWVWRLFGIAGLATAFTLSGTVGSARAATTAPAAVGDDPTTSYLDLFGQLPVVVGLGAVVVGLVVGHRYWRRHLPRPDLIDIAQALERPNGHRIARALGQPPLDQTASVLGEPVAVRAAHRSAAVLAGV